jgi:hypothetical protein
VVPILDRMLEDQEAEFKVPVSFPPAFPCFS